MRLRITGHDDGQRLLDLPWSLPLIDWPAGQLVALPRGISRHVVRFVRVGDEVYAVKEVGERAARKEYHLLRDLERLDVPVVDPLAVVTGRQSATGQPLEPVLVTRHLQFSLPYRALFSQTLRPDTMVRLLDALSLLLVQLHSNGFYWGDCSLSNTLFRRDAGAFAAYLVDAETGELHPVLSDGQRHHDLEIAHDNIIGELMDLQEGGLLDEDLDPIATGDDVIARYEGLWCELTRVEVVGADERHRIAARIRRLNDLGFDVQELQMDESGSSISIQPKVVDAGHHSRRLLRLTGLDAEENQARRLLNDLDGFRAGTGLQDEPEEIVAHAWLAQVFHRVVDAVPKEMRGKLEPAELFHEVLEHRWFLSERAGHDVGIEVTVTSYLRDVLVSKPEEKTATGGEPLAPASGDAPSHPT